MTLTEQYQQVCQKHKLLISYTPGITYATLPAEVKELLNAAKENVQVQLPETVAKLFIRTESSGWELQLDGLTYWPEFDDCAISTYLTSLLTK